MMSGIFYLWLINQLPWTPVLSRKFASWKLLLLDARYCVNRWNVVECFYKSEGFVFNLGGTSYLIPIAHEVMYRYEALVHNHPVGIEGPLYQEVSQGRDRDIGLVCTLKQIWKHDDITLIDLPSFSWDLQSRCFFFGPMISSVVALHTALARPWPARLCRAARILSLRVCPPGFCILTWSRRYLSFLTDLKLNTDCLLMTGRGQHWVRCNILCCVCQLCHGTVCLEPAADSATGWWA